ncbi:MFS transporter, partial [Geobacillus subterraneus]
IEFFPLPRAFSMTEMPYLCWAFLYTSTGVNSYTTKKEMLKDIKVWQLTLVYFANYTAMYGLGFWLPSIVKSLTENVSSNLQIGWITMIPALVGMISLLFMGWNASRTNSHRIHIVISFLIALIGFGASAFATSSVIMIILLSFAAIGLYGFAGVYMAYMTFFFTESTAPVGIALVNSFASLGGFVGPMIFGLVTIKSGMLLLAALAAIGMCTTIILKSKQPTVDANVKAELV